MILKRFYEESLAHASYLVGCPASGEALVIDPGRDVGIYLDAAASENLRITAVTETHIHADLLSGSRELATQTGATLYLSDEGGPDWKYDIDQDTWNLQSPIPQHLNTPTPQGIQLVRNGDEIRIGAIRIDVMHTPGHTPEHISFVLYDTALHASTLREPPTNANDKSQVLRLERDNPGPDDSHLPHVPAMVFTGDFIFVGDVGRPDLLESAAGIQGTMEPAARSLFRSLTEFTSLPEHVLLWPAHGAGSACGKSLGGVPVTTLGYEMRTNWALLTMSEKAFVREVLSGQPEPPTYFAVMKRMNKHGPPLLSGAATPVRIESLPESAVLVDIRMPREFARRHAPGSTNHPLFKNFVTWAGWLLPYDRDLHLISDSPEDVHQAVRRLSLIGLDRVASWSGSESLERPDPRGSTGEPAQAQSHQQGSFQEGVPPGALLIDVRSQSEWEAGHVPDALHIPLGYLRSRLAEIPRDQPLAVYCQSGGRSPIAASVLQAAGFQDVVDLEDGWEGFRKSVVTA